MELRILGPLEIWHGGRKQALGSPKERRLLAILGASAGEPLTLDVLLDRMWGDDQPSSAVPTLHTYLSRLRRHLKELADGDVRLESSTSRSYRLRISPDAVDLVQLRQLRHQAQKATREGHSERAVELLHQAQQLWRGEPFSEFSGNWFDMMRGRLREDVRSMREERIHLELGLGRHADLVGELRELVNEDPLAQNVVADLMLALYRCGRHDKALALYHTTRRKLDEELGLPPGSLLSQIHQKILDQDSSLDIPQSGSPSAMAPSAVSEVQLTEPRNYLPRDSRDFTGRIDELNRLLFLQDQHETAVPLTVIHGMAGVGKTALAVHAAHLLREEYPDGLFYVNLHAHSEQDPCGPVEALQILIGKAEEEGAANLNGKDNKLDLLAAYWRNWLSHRRCLLVLDDAYSAAQIRPLLPGSPTCRVFITSRHRLTNLDGTESLGLETMQRSEATSLFSRIVGAARTTDAMALHQVVDLCGCLPLAIQITAHRFRNRESWNLQTLVDRLTRAADLLAEIDLPSDIATAFRFSYTQLDEAEQHLFRRLSLHPGPDIGLGAAVVLADTDSHEALRGLEELTDCYLLEEPVSGRYKFHDLIRSFALRVSREEDRETTLRAAARRLSAYYLTTADLADRQTYPLRRRIDITVGQPIAAGREFGDSNESSAWLSIERNNLLAVARQAANVAPDIAAAFPHVLAQSFKFWGTSETTSELQEAAIETLRNSGSKTSLAQSLVERAEALCHENYQLSLQYAEESLQLFRELDDPHGQADSLFQAGRAELSAARRSSSLNYLDEAIKLYRRIKNRHGEAEVLNVQGVALHFAGELNEAVKKFQRVMEISRDLGDIHGQATALLNTGEIHFIEKRYEKALESFTRSLSLARQIGERRQLAHLYTNLGALSQVMGNAEKSLAYSQKALSSYKTTRDPRSRANTLLTMAAAYQEVGQHTKAMQYFFQAERIAQEIGNPYERQNALLGIGATQRILGQYQEAFDTYQKALEVAEEIDIPLGIARALEGIAQTLFSVQEIAIARDYATRALSVYERLGVLEDIERISQWLSSMGHQRPD